MRLAVWGMGGRNSDLATSAPPGAWQWTSGNEGTDPLARILIAEDEANIFQLVEFRLQRLGHEIFWAQDGEQALKLAGEHAPDVIMLDVMMPVLDGFQVLKRLKADPATRAIPVIMLTARGQESDIVSGIEGGANGYVVKPFSFPELIARVNAALASSNA